jgi:hypothetical protein
VVTVEPAVGGLPTSGFQLTVTVGPASRIVAAGGWLATPTPADRYPLIGVAQALKRLAAVQVGPPVVDPGVPVRCVRGPCPAPAPPTPRPRTPVTVTGVRLGLQFAPVLGGATPTSTAYLVPAYLFQLSNGVTEPVIAVQDRFLSRPAPPATAAPLRTLPGG